MHWLKEDISIGFMMGAIAGIIVGIIATLFIVNSHQVASSEINFKCPDEPDCVCPAEKTCPTCPNAWDSVGQDIVDAEKVQTKAQKLFERVEDE